MAVGKHESTGRRSSSDLARLQARGAETQAGPDSVALSVTRHSQITGQGQDGPQEWRFLSCGIDSLDIGIGVQWEAEWAELLRDLQESKEFAKGSSGRPWRELCGQQVLILPGGKPNFRFHLQTVFGHLYIGVDDCPRSRTPNLYYSLSSMALWCLGLDACVDHIKQIIQELKGQLLYLKPSRVDLCADFLIPEGLTLEFLRSHRVSRSQKTNQHEENDVLQTFYVGEKGAPTQLRIYDKGLELSRNESKNWFLDQWGVNTASGVWRVEYQIRRPVLQGLRINDLTMLDKMQASLWYMLTHDWVSLRLQDNSNTSRRTVHPWWVDVQNVAAIMGEAQELTRKAKSYQPASAEWYVNHTLGCMSSYAALRGHDSLTHTLEDFRGACDRKLTQDQFAEIVYAKKLRFNRALLPTKGSYPEGWDIP